MPSKLRSYPLCSASRLTGVDVATGHDGIVVPHGPVGIDHREPAGRVVDDRCILVDQLVRLLRIEEQIDDFPHSIAVLNNDAVVLEDAGPAEGIAGVVAAVIRRPRQVHVPGQLPPPVGLGMMIEEPVLAGDVAVVDRLVDGVITIIAFEIHVRPPPRFVAAAVPA